MNELYIRSLQLCPERVPDTRSYPYNLPIVRNLTELTFDKPVTFLIGENGTGKSTLVEAIAACYGFNPEGGSKNFRFSTANTHSSLHEAIKLVKGYKRPADGFFFRAESFYNLATEVENLIVSPNDSFLHAYGGKSLHHQSHGESFMSLFMNRFWGNGLYILDEPEAALSPTRQMALLSKIHQLVQENSQLIIATHSPIILAYPDADIYEITEATFYKTVYKETEHYRITRTFLNRTEAMLKELMQ